MDAIARLKADRRKVEDLFAKFEKARETGKKQALAAEICLALTIHAKIEEDIFYPACQGEIDEDLWHEAFVEHDAAKVLIREIEKGSPDDEFYDAKMKVLSEIIKHHVREEEKKQGNMLATPNGTWGSGLTLLCGRVYVLPATPPICNSDVPFDAQRPRFV